jgi:hypothetical protein
MGVEDRSMLQASIDERVERLRSSLSPLLGPRLMNDLVHKSLDYHRQQPARAAARRAPSVKFLARADAFLAAHEIADRTAETRQREVYAPLANHDVELIAIGAVRTIAQLRYIEDAFFTYWNEAPPNETRAFWEEVGRAGLPYTRRNLLAEILERGRIPSRAHYDRAVDALMSAVQEGLITESDADRLGRMIDAYEKRAHR